MPKEAQTSAAVMSDKSPVDGSVRRSIFQSVGGQLSYVLAQMLVLAALARYEGVEATGAFGIAMAIATPIFLLANMGLRTGLSTDAKRLYSFPIYVGLAIVTGIIGLAVSVTLEATVLKTDLETSLLTVIALMKAVESVSFVCYGAFQLKSRMNLVSRSLALRGWLSAGLFVVLLAAGASVPIAFLAQLFVWFIVLIFHDYPLASRLLDGRISKPSFEPMPLYQLARTYLPLSLSGFINSVMNILPRLVLERYFGLASVGIFTVVAYFMQAGTMVVNAVNQALLGRFASLRLENASRAQLQHIVRPLLLAAAGLSIVSVLAVYLVGQTLLVTAFGPAFGEGFPLLFLVALSVTTKLFGIVPQALVHADRRFGLFLVYEVLSVMLIFALLVAFVPTYGLIGAGFSILLVAVFRLIFLSVASLHSLKSKIT